LSKPFKTACNRRSFVEPILFVDLDQSLIKTDVFREQLLRSLATSFWKTLKIIFMARFRPERVKDIIVKSILIDPATLPYNSEVIQLIHEAKHNGRTVVLATATHERVAVQVADYLGLFDSVLATTSQSNCKGKNKLAAMQQFAGKQSFNYVGDSAADRAIFPFTNTAYIVGNRPYSLPHIRLARPSIILPLLKTLHPIQWIKNIAIFLPLILYRRFDMHSFLITLTGFFSFSLVTSGIYMVKDIVSIEADRHNPKKKKGSFANGSLTIGEGMIASLFLIMVAIILTSFLESISIAILTTYFFFSLLLFQPLIRNHILKAGIIYAGLILRIVYGYSIIGAKPFI
jgi:phosphoserine phosphatase